ncbi:Alpha/beta hydrolase-3 [Corchorus olitorius]|uniref:Alpha/beta hydrolase-3 n=1 Tax=Corchorus olitorius TaxID=93759 RepID=A0A1R3KNL5_9ROSI|nr:Alpha/beta hydrolase-3 [Corchorus olitorius]
MDPTAKEVVKEVPGLIKVYKDGSVERLLCSPYVPPSPEPDPETGVSSKDITISENPSISARLFLPKLITDHQKLPILVYFHAGAFCLESAFSFLHHRYLNALVSQAKVVAISVEYRLAPEHFLPAAYQDSWAALQWVVDVELSKKDPWLFNHGDFDRIFIGGDSAGANLAHYVALQAGTQGLKCGVKILGAFLSNPYFWGSKSPRSDQRPPIDHHDKSVPSLIWDLVYPSAPGGIDNPLINPFGAGKPSLAGLGCSKILVCVSEKDELSDFGVLYFDEVKKSGWKGEIELFEVKGEGHLFHIVDLGKENSKILIKRLASFLA